MSTVNRWGSFFAPILTKRHILTQRRWITALALVALPLALVAAGTPVFKWVFDPPGATGDQASKPVAGSDSPLAARPLSVATRPVSQAGPGFLKQRFTGIVTPRRTTRLAAKVLGRVERIRVDIGDPVQADQLLIELDQGQLLSERGVIQANLSAAQAVLAELEYGPRLQEVAQGEARVNELQSLVELQQANLLRSESLNQSASISAQELDESRFRTDAMVAQLRSAQSSLDLLREGTRTEQLDAQRASVAGLTAQLQSLDIQLAEKRITAPYAGHIQARLADEGQIVAAGEPLLEIVETGVLEVHVGLPVELTNDLTDDSLAITLDQQPLTARLTRVSPTIQATTRTREVVLSLYETAYQQLALGTAVEVELQTRLEAQGYWIPTAALTSGARGLWAVFIAVPIGNTPAENAQLGHQTRAHQTRATHRIERRQVELLRSQADWSEIRGPLDPSEQLLVDGVHRVVANQVVIIDAQPADK
jgi:RND family efflux transporter MFP subunit